METLAVRFMVIAGQNLDFYCYSTQMQKSTNVTMDLDSNIHIFWAAYDQSHIYTLCLQLSQEHILSYMTS